MKTNPLAELKKASAASKGRWLKSPPKPDTSVLSALKKEHSPAIAANVPSRNYRIGTLIHSQYGEELEELMIKIRQRTGKKPKLAEALESAIVALKEKYEA